MEGTGIGRGLAWKFTIDGLDQISKFELQARIGNRESKGAEAEMAVFDEEDRETVKSLALTFAGFAALTVFLIICALFVT